MIHKLYQNQYLAKIEDWGLAFHYMYAYSVLQMHPGVRVTSDEY